MACLIFRASVVFSALHSRGKLPQDINTAAARFVSLPHFHTLLRLCVAPALAASHHSKACVACASDESPLNGRMQRNKTIESVVLASELTVVGKADWRGQTETGMTRGQPREPH